MAGSDENSLDDEDNAKVGAIELLDICADDEELKITRLLDTILEVLGAIELEGDSVVDVTSATIEDNRLVDV